MWNIPTDEELNKTPPFYATEDIDYQDKIIHLHFFISASDWYVAEYDPKNKLFFDFIILNGDCPTPQAAP